MSVLSIRPSTRRSSGGYSVVNRSVCFGSFQTKSRSRDLIEFFQSTFTFIFRYLQQKLAQGQKLYQMYFSITYEPLISRCITETRFTPDLWVQKMMFLNRDFNPLCLLFWVQMIDNRKQNHTFKFKSQLQNVPVFERRTKIIS